MTTDPPATVGAGPGAGTPLLRDLTEQHDWAATPLGARTAWPQSLRTSVDLMLASGHAMCLIWGPARILLYNDAYAPVLGARHPAALGQPTATVWPELWADIAPLVDRAFAGESLVFRDQPLTMTRHGFEERTWWDFAYSPIRDEAGAVAGMLNVTSDCTARVLTMRERDAAIAELRDSEAFMSSVLAASTDCIKVLELDGTLSFMSEGGMGVMEVSDFNAVKGCPWPDLLRDDGPDLARAALAAARAGQTSHFEAPADTLGGTPKHWSVSVSPIPGPDGRVARILSVSRDHTELARAREQQKLLAGELAHRLKNMFSVVQAIAFQTLGTVGDQGAVRDFNARLKALADAQDVLTRESWSSARLRTIAEGALATFDGDGRLALAGPDVTIGPRAALALSLLLHELATNAVKYGALRVPGGHIRLAWSLTTGDDGPVLTMAWVERGGPPAVAPTRRGFGSRIIRLGLVGSGGVDLRYEQAGFSAHMVAPLSQLQRA